jgi:hypothetical protein
LIAEQPLLCGALGVALGAAIASLLPRTSTEDELMGDVSDSVKNAARHFASEQVRDARETAARVVQKTHQAAEEEGLTPAGLSERARSAGDRLRQESLPAQPEEHLTSAAADKLS